MGRLVRSGRLQTRQQLADWLQQNLGQNEVPASSD